MLGRRDCGLRNSASFFTATFYFGRCYVKALASATHHAPWCIAYTGRYDRTLAAVGLELLAHTFLSSGLSELPAYELLLLLRSERSLHERVGEAADLLLSSGFAAEEEEASSEKKTQSDGENSEQRKPDGKTASKGKDCDNMRSNLNMQSISVVILSRTAPAPVMPECLGRATIFW